VISRLEELPDESTFSRAFGELPRVGLAERVHQALTKRTSAQN